MLTDDEVFARISPQLQMDLQVIEVFDADADAQIAQCRRVGRQAAHSLGHRAFTRIIDSKERGRIGVIVVAVADPDHPDRQRVTARSRELLRWEGMGPRDDDPA